MGGAKGSDDDSGSGGTAPAPVDELSLRAFDEGFSLLPKDHASAGTIYLERPGGQWEPSAYSGKPISFSAGDGWSWGAFVPGKSTPQFLVTLSQVSAASPALGVVSRLNVESIFQQLVIPSELDPDSAQVLVRVTDGSGTPLAQVVPDVPEARDIIYANLGSWIEATDQTSSEGMFLAANLPAEAFPGSTTTIKLRGAVQGSFDVPIAAGGITVFVVAFD